MSATKSRPKWISYLTFNHGTTCVFCYRSGAWIQKDADGLPHGLIGGSRILPPNTDIYRYGLARYRTRQRALFLRHLRTEHPEYVAQVFGPAAVRPSSEGTTDE